MVAIVFETDTVFQLKHHIFHLTVLLLLEYVLYNPFVAKMMSHDTFPNLLNRKLVVNLFSLKNWTSKAVPLSQAFAVLNDMMDDENNTTNKKFDA